VSFDPVLAEIRFGVGVSPVIAAPGSVDEMLARLIGADAAAAAFPVPVWAEAEPSPRQFREVALSVREAGTEAEREAAEALRDAQREAGRELVATNMVAELGRSVITQDGMRERLTRFWADHFTIRATTGNTRHLVSPYVEETIRPHLAGRFATMLRAVATHPMMLLYLDQHLSMGPNSTAAQRNNRGLNENMARELLELHTLGVDGSYDQSDVRQLAKLLTGLSYTPQNGFAFRAQNAEPGAETVLGRSYGGGEARLDDILAALDDLAVHPDTARHLSAKLARHFIGPEPAPDLLAAMVERYLDSEGDLLATYEAMLRHPQAWGPERRNVKQPMAFLATAMRALAVPPDRLKSASLQDVRRIVMRPMRVMGQPWQEPPGPDGWAEEDSAWVTPQGMAGRITWAMTMPRQLVTELPDPRDFVQHALGPTPPEAVSFAAGAAESVTDGIGVILASAAFQRR